MPKKRIQEKPSYLYIFPIAFVIAVVPLIVFMKLDTLSAIEMKNWYGESTYTDFFNYYKSQWLMIGTVLAIIFYFAQGLSKKLEVKKSFIYIPTGIYAGFIILSTLFSKNKDVALNGFVARYEGMISLLCYLALMLITYNLVKSEYQVRFLLGALLISATIICVIGLFQLIGVDIYRTNFVKSLIIPKVFQTIADNLEVRFEKSVVFSTFSNSNYIGSYVALALPIAFVSLLCVKKLYFKVGAALLTVLLVLSLLGSRSRAGLVGVAVIIILAIILFRKYLFRRKFVTLAVILGAVALFAGVNIALKGALTERILKEFTQSDETQYYNLQDIIFEQRKVTLVSSTETFVIKLSEDSRLYFYNNADEAIDYDMTDIDGGKYINFTEAPYENYSIILKGDIITISNRDSQVILRAKSDYFVLIGNHGEEVKAVHKPESIGFAGRERLGSARGYIWSRTLPVIKNSPLIGYGPDNYVIAFPQDDYIGKIKAYGTAHMIIDKPHNLFLQIAVNTGVPALIAFLVLIGLYFAQSLKLYFKNINGSLTALAGTAIFLSISGYLTAGLFNDSVVGIAPIFWVLLGLGFACNYILLGHYAKEGLIKNA
jgi:O-antigen ligase